MAVLDDPIETTKKLSLPSGEELFQAYALDIGRFLARKVDNRETAEDLSQEVFYRACKALPGLHEPLNARAWLYRIAINVSNDYFRHFKKISYQSIDLWEEEREMEYPNLQGGDPAERVAENDCIQAALHQLPSGYRLALLLRDHEGYSPEQVADAVGIARSGGKMYVSRARQRFREYYAAAQ